MTLETHRLQLVEDVQYARGSHWVNVRLVRDTGTGAEFLIVDRPEAVAVVQIKTGGAP